MLVNNFVKIKESGTWDSFLAEGLQAIKRRGR
jgi:hypothetical protein